MRLGLQPGTPPALCRHSCWRCRGFASTTTQRWISLEEAHMNVRGTWIVLSPAAAVIVRSKTFAMKTFHAIPIALTFAVLCSCVSWEYPSANLAARVRSELPHAVLPSTSVKKTGDSYKGQVIQVGGRIQRVIAKGGQPALILEGGLLCGFARPEKRIVESLRKGQIVVLKGILEYTIRGTMGPYMTPCVILSVATDDNRKQGTLRRENTYKEPRRRRVQ
jgi:hypothetical protein